MRLMAQANSLLISQCDGERLAEEIAMSAICQYCNKRAGATRHRFELDLAHDRVERVTCTVSLRFI